ncbi:hypothetical protein GGU10DRAFT_421022 [Lentinula aff. detonsa]|uniref:Extradiol ring-cleavage dioxygenase class III enzyme subunit B domain-containing protein n=1 Tax=Lentinula aff. detonsa TaxID=2804958 RepID=A0AA38KAE2_9AGAR|nr:hypothetical protein GGU10DRAFT_421022 [Lentinula aff. detonsa]
MSPEANRDLGQVVKVLREENVLLLAGGLPIHNIQDFGSFTPDTAQPIYHSFHKAILDALQVSNCPRKEEGIDGFAPTSWIPSMQSTTQPEQARTRTRRF